MGESTPYLMTVYMDQIDVTPWVTSVTVEQPPQCLYRQWSVTFAGFTELAEDASWDIYGSYTEATPRAECLVRAGVIPEDRERYITITPGEVPTLTVRGYDQVWRSQRRAPRETLVLVPGDDSASAVRAIEEYGQPVGRYRVRRHVRTLHQALDVLATGAGFNLHCATPNYPMLPYVVPPTSSYWDAMLELLRPWVTEVWYRRADNLLTVIDPLAARYELGRRMVIPDDLVVSVHALPVRRRRVRRVLLRVPRWR